MTSSRDLDDFWIADFLTSGVCIDADRTVYKGIKRLPPAHCLSATASGCAVRRYWQLGVEDPIHYPKRRQYIDHFEDVLTHAIKDRLPSGRWDLDERRSRFPDVGGTHLKDYRRRFESGCVYVSFRAPHAGRGKKLCLSRGEEASKSL